ncbi:hypothetical protein At1g04090 [Henckelia pumila]|uniref:hypothetical protein At1g04090 n=1 Tax=Henckelia pumila TaxID=405737 RepID=UPI003C6E80DB
MMGNRLNVLSKISDRFKKKKQPLPIETSFKLPSQLPSWPPGGDFARGTIDLGGLEICQVSAFTKVWTAHEGGPDNLGATFFEASTVPDGFFILGCYSQPNNKALNGWILAAKDVTCDPCRNVLKPPIDYSLVWSSESLKIKQDGVGYIWLPIPPEGYKVIGHVVTNSPQKPALDKVRCVEIDFTDDCENGALIWSLETGVNVYISRPRVRGVEAMGILAGTFVARTNGVESDVLACLKNADGSRNAMPNVEQIKALVEAYSLHIYFHPDENYFPSSVTWFFRNGALLYAKGDESNPVSIDETGSNLPQGGGNDGAFWIDLPTDDASKERVKKGDLAEACAYLHVKPMFGGTFTDIAIWVFYPFNGPAKAKVEFFNISLGKIGEHVGDWEHVTLRISNLDGELKSVYFGQHSRGIWLDSSELEFENGNRPVAYSSLSGHASYPRPGLVLQGSGNIGIRNDSAKSKVLMEVGAKFVVVKAEYLGSIFVEPAWLNYGREWGPKIRYSIEDELKKVEKVLPGKLKRLFDKIVRSLPNEVLGEEGPTGPKGKDSWMGDERD